MEYLLRMLAERQPPGAANLVMNPEAKSPHDVVVDLAYSRNGWLIRKHYHIHVTEVRASVFLENFHITRL